MLRIKKRSEILFAWIFFVFSSRVVNGHVISRPLIWRHERSTKTHDAEFLSALRSMGWSDKIPIIGHPSIERMHPIFLTSLINLGAPQSIVSLCFTLTCVKFITLPITYLFGVSVTKDRKYIFLKLYLDKQLDALLILRNGSTFVKICTASCYWCSCQSLRWQRAYQRYATIIDYCNVRQVDLTSYQSRAYICYIFWTSCGVFYILTNNVCSLCGCIKN